MKADPDKKNAPRWWKPPLDRGELQGLMKRNDYRALLSYGLWLALLAASGTFAAVLYPDPWCIPVFLAYGTIFSTCNPRWHESLHGTPFKTAVLNRILYFVGTAMDFRDVVYTRWSHLNHHAYTIITDTDLEISAPRPVKLWKLALDLFSIYSAAVFVPVMILHSLGIPDRNALRVVPKSKLRKMFWAARAVLGLHIAAIAAAVVLRSWLPILLFTLPRIYGGALIFLFVLPQHAGLAADVHDHRLNCRTMILNPVFSFLYMHMEYHTEHHLYPNVPFHALPRLHRRIRSYLPKPYRGLWAAWREMIPALIRQRKDPEYFIRRELPDTG